MKPPCVHVVMKILPAIRTLIAKELVESRGLSISEAARRMGLTQAAVSQYLSGSRGKSPLHDLESYEKPRVAVEDLTQELTRQDTKLTNVLDKVCNVCVSLHREGVAKEFYEENPLTYDVRCKLAFASGDIWDVPQVKAEPTSGKVRIEVGKDVYEELEKFMHEVGASRMEDAIFEAIDMARAWRSHTANKH